MNLPNALTVGRIAAAPFIAWLPFAGSATLRFAAFLLFAIAAITDYIDGYLARTRREETALGRMLDPMADKLLLVATLVPMFVLTGSDGAFSLFSPHSAPLVSGVVGAVAAGDGTPVFPFVTPIGLVGLPWWILAVILGRELFMSVFRQIARHRGVEIPPIGPAKWKTAMQLIWAGAAFFWFFIATLAVDRRWGAAGWREFAYFNGTVGVLTMTGATVLTVYSLVLYVRSYSALLPGGSRRGM